MKTIEENVKSRADYAVNKFGKPIEHYGEETVLEGDIYVKKVKVTMIEPHEQFDKFSTNDFSINHLMAVGATDMLQDMTGKFGEVGLDKIDSFDKNISEE